ncbi:MAG: HlyD family efflux transporter periplasmic adaptor subunit [Betaproteobacteria bacterium]|nr:HlyD family efflux transporter periplasmic adaptor subunit [Betaproteobacteria bacterium]
MPDPAPLPRLRQDLKLFPGAAHADGSPTWRVLDPVRNRFFEIGWLEFELLRRWNDSEDATALIHAVAADTTLRPTLAEVTELARFLDQHQLLRAASALQRAQLRARALAPAAAWWKQLLHHYLFFRIPLVRPDAFLDATQAWVRPFYTRGFVRLTVAVAVIAFFLVLRQADAFAQTFLYFFSAQGLFFYALAASFAKVLHELGHAYTAKRYGVRVPTMGVAFLVLWPVLYTDTSETWKLMERRQRFAIAAAGMTTELALAVFATLAWSLAPDGALRSVFFLLATTTWLLTLAINASPFMRFDGYFLLSDALGMPNLHERSFALARWWLRRTFFRLEDEMPEPELTATRRRALIAFALATWIYRLVLFLGIAVLVYYLFFKLLGILLMLVEVGWFVVRPVAGEISVLRRRRAELRPAWRPFAALGAAIVLLIWLVPVERHVTAPALLRAQQDYAVYAQTPARVGELAVQPGQSVAAGALLVKLESPELQLRLTKATLEAEALTLELARTPASPLQRERMRVTQEQLAQTLAEQQGARNELAQLELHAPFAGVVRDLSPEIVAGRWVNSRRPLMRVVAPARYVIDAYVDEAQVRAIQVGNKIRFYPDRAGAAPVVGRVTSVDAASTRQVAHPLLASVHGGGLATVKTDRGALVAHDAVYRVEIVADEDQALPDSVMRGSVHVDTGLFALAGNFVSRLLALLVRESGF